jgi:hypothetical protein
VDELGVVGEDVMDLEGLVFLFDQNVFVELLHKLNVFQLALVGDVHEGLSSVDVDDCHGD